MESDIKNVCFISLSLLLLLVESILCFIRNDKALERRERGLAEDYCLLYMYTEDDQVMEYHHNVQKLRRDRRGKRQRYRKKENNRQRKKCREEKSMNMYIHVFQKYISTLPPFFSLPYTTPSLSLSFLTISCSSSDSV